MSVADEFARTVAGAPNWDVRVAEVRKIADQVSRSQQAAVYAAVARAFYVPNLTYEFAEVAWPPSLTADLFIAQYEDAARITNGFTMVSDDDLRSMLTTAPSTLRVLRLIIGFTQQELNGKGWERAGDALGPVVRDCEGRVFTPATLNELLTVDPFPQLVAQVC